MENCRTESSEEHIKRGRGKEKEGLCREFRWTDSPTVRINWTVASIIRCTNSGPGICFEIHKSRPSSRICTHFSSSYNLCQPTFSFSPFSPSFPDTVIFRLLPVCARHDSFFHPLARFSLVFFSTPRIVARTYPRHVVLLAILFSSYGRFTCLSDRGSGLDN